MSALEQAATAFRVAHAAHIEALRAWFRDLTPNYVLSKAMPVLPTETKLDDARRELLKAAIAWGQP